MAKRFKAEYKVYFGNLNYLNETNSFDCIGQFESIENARCFLNARFNDIESEGWNGNYLAILDKSGNIVNTTHPLLDENDIKCFL